MCENANNAIILTNATERKKRTKTLARTLGSWPQEGVHLRPFCTLCRCIQRKNSLGQHTVMEGLEVMKYR